MGDVLPVSVTVILPTRNEEEALGPTIDAIPRGWCKDLEIMIVDGNSSDRTREIALEKDISRPSGTPKGLRPCLPNRL